MQASAGFSARSFARPRDAAPKLSRESVVGRFGPPHEDIPRSKRTHQFVLTIHSKPRFHDFCKQVYSETTAAFRTCTNERAEFETQCLKLSRGPPRGGLLDWFFKAYGDSSDVACKTGIGPGRLPVPVFAPAETQRRHSCNK